MKLSKRALNFMFKNNNSHYNNEINSAIHPLITGLLLKSYGYNDDVVSAGYLLDILKSGCYSLDDISKLFGGNVASLLITALPASKSGNLTWKENANQFFKSIANLPENNIALICADIIAYLESIDLYFSKIGKADYSILPDNVDNLKWYYNTLYETFSQKYDLAIVERLKSDIDVVFESGYFYDYTKGQFDGKREVNSEEELINLKRVISDEKSYIIELIGTGNEQTRTLHSKVKDFLDNDNFKVRVVDETKPRSRFETEIIQDKVGISSFEKNLLLSSSIRDGLLGNIIDDQNVILLSDDAFDILLYLKRLLNKGIISFDDVKSYCYYYIKDLNYLVNATGFHYNAFAKEEKNKNIDEQVANNIRNLVSGLSSEQKLTDRDTTLVVAGALLPIMPKSKILELKKYMCEEEAA